MLAGNAIRAKLSLCVMTITVAESDSSFASI
jgi:hypothetical protein